MKDFKYITNISQSVAEIRIYKRIGGADGVNGSDFANEIAYLQNKTDLINVRINSGGGSVLDAMAIQAAIMNSAVPCDTYIDGVAASAAGTIAVSGRKVYIADNGLFMAHNTIDESKNPNKKLTAVFDESVATHLANRTGKTPEEVQSMMSKETWLNAKQCLEQNIVDEIISTKKKIKTPKVTNAFELEKIYNEFLSPKKTEMKNINNELNLSVENSDESTVISAIKAIKNENEALKAKVEAFEKEKKDAAEAEKTALTNDVTDYANKLEAEKKIKPEEKAALILNASVSRSTFDFIKNTFDKISNVKESKKIFKPEDVKNDGEDRSSWSYMDWFSKDSKGLENMMKSDPEKFNALAAAASE